LKHVFLTVTLMLGVFSASSVIAAERYTEVWNPPEAQAVKGKSAKSRAAATPTANKKKRKAGTAVKQVADKASQADMPGIAPRAKSPVSPKPSEPVIPRKIEPNGQVMRV
jgi:hypothetical protein